MQERHDPFEVHRWQFVFKEQLFLTQVILEIV